MNRALQTVIVGLTGLAAVLSVPSVAAARAPEPPISARVDRVNLSSDPWRPSGTAEVTLRNNGTQTERGYYVMAVPRTADLDGGEGCNRTPEDSTVWICGGAEISAGGSHTYRVPVVSASAVPLFGVQDLGYVAGRSSDGQVDRRTDFLISWPDRMPLQLDVRPVRGGPTSGTVRLTAKVTNAGTFAISGYSLMIDTPAGVTVTGPDCNGAHLPDRTDCEVHRDGDLAAGATDSLAVRLSVTDGPQKVTFWLAPAGRYTNEDTRKTLTVGRTAGATPSHPASPTVTATASATPSRSINPVLVAGGDGGGDLPITGSAVTAAVMTGAVLLVGGAMLLLLGGRRRTR